MHEDAVDRLLNQEQAFDYSSKADFLFLKAMQSAFSLHYNNNNIYKKLCRKFFFTKDSIKSMRDISSIPHIFVNVFKERKLLSIPPEKVSLVLTSSGTKGKKSKMYLDDNSLKRIRKIVKNIYNSYGMYNKSQKVNYLCFTYDIKFARNLGTAFSDELLSSLTDINNIYFAIQYDRNKKDFYLDKESCFKILEKYQEEGLPVRMLGFPSFLYEVVNEAVQRRKKFFKFNPESYILTGGGWKTLQDKEIPKDKFRHWAKRNLGIPVENVRDLYGLVEHGIPYSECEYGRMHIPIYSRAYIRDPGTLKLLGYDKVGLIHLVTPYLTTLPAISILTGDFGKIKKSCRCARNAPVLEITGRAGITKHKGCAVSALDILGKNV